MSQQVPPERDIIAAVVPADHRCHMPWTIQVIFSYFKSVHYILFLSKCNTNSTNFFMVSIGTRYQSLDRGGLVDPHDREFIPIREPRDRSRDRSLERGLYLEDELYGRSARQSPNALGGNYIRLYKDLFSIIAFSHNSLKKKSENNASFRSYPTSNCHNLKK